MKPWRIVIESGLFQRETHFPAPAIEESPPVATTPDEPSRPPALNVKKALELLADARSNLRKAQDASNTQKVFEINNWYGGGLAILSAVTGREPSSLTDEMIETFGGGPIRTQPDGLLDDGRITNGRVTMVPVERTRPKPPPGAPKPVDFDSLSEEEREGLGLVLDGYGPEDDEIAEAESDEPEAPEPEVGD